jgi:hypothetical protein
MELLFGSSISFSYLYTIIKTQQTMDTFEEWKQKRSSENADTNKMLILYMIIAFAVAAFCA